MLLHQSLPGAWVLTINDVVLQPVEVVHDLTVLLDNQLALKHHINRVASTCFFDLRRLRHIKRHVLSEVMKHLVAAVILSRLDYCNSVLTGLPWSTVSAECCSLPRFGLVTTWPCQFGICWTALVANTLSRPVQIGTIDAYGTQQQVSSIH